MCWCFEVLACICGKMVHLLPLALQLPALYLRQLLIMLCVLML